MVPRRGHSSISYFCCLNKIHTWTYWIDDIVWDKNSEYLYRTYRKKQSLSLSITKLLMVIQSKIPNSLCYSIDQKREDCQEERVGVRVEVWSKQKRSQNK